MFFGDESDLHVVLAGFPRTGGLDVPADLEPDARRAFFLSAGTKRSGRSHHVRTSGLHVDGVERVPEMTLEAAVDVTITRRHAGA